MTLHSKTSITIAIASQSSRKAGHRGLRIARVDVHCHTVPANAAGQMDIEWRMKKGPRISCTLGDSAALHAIVYGFDEGPDATKRLDFYMAALYRLAFVLRAPEQNLHLLTRSALEALRTLGQLESVPDGETAITDEGAGSGARASMLIAYDPAAEWSCSELRALEASHDGDEFAVMSASASRLDRHVRNKKQIEK